MKTKSFGKNTVHNFSLALKKIFLLSCLTIFVSQKIFAESKSSDSAGQKTSTTITILNALKTSNKKDAETDEDLILFEGNVRISVEKDGSKTVISADQISYSRKRDMLYAEGNVSLEQTEKGGSVSNISATSVLFNTATLEGIFDDGQVVQADSNSINLPSGSTLIVGSDIFARNHTGTIAFKKGTLTFCNAEHPHWKIKATRIWLLPGNEFAFFNAVMFLDNIPVFYLPAFYYPKDELVFNPVFSYKNRQGFSIQTTTYLIGRKPLDTSSSSSSDPNDIGKYFNLVKPTKLMNQELQGIVLHNLDTVYTGDTTNHLKLMLDWYSNLGLGVGIDGAYKPKKILSTLEGNILLGFGNTIFQSGNAYLPFGQSGKRYYEKSNFMGLEIPFRFRAGLTVGISEPFSLTLSLPIYSDPFFNYDYGDRKEDMDWFSYLLNNPMKENTTLTEQQKLDAAEITSFNWDLSGNYSVKLPDVLRPYIDTVSISSFNSAIAFASKSVDTSGKYLDKTDNYHLYTPQRKFFFPSQITPVKISSRISGTLLSIGDSKSRSGEKVKYPVELISPQELVAEEKEKSETKAKSSEEENGFSFEKNALIDIDYSPTLTQAAQNFKFNLDYSIEPSFASQLTYSPVGLNVAGDFNWDKIQSSYISVKAPVKFNDSLSIKNDFFRMTNSVTLNPAYQTHPYLSKDRTYGGYTDAEIATMKKADFTSSAFDIQNANTVSFKPLTYIPAFKDTGISWNTNIKILRTKFIGDAEHPEWDWLTADWNDSESITSHSLDFTLAANELGGDFAQSLVLTTTLPPQTSKYYGTLKLVFPFVTLTGEAGVRQKDKDSNEWVPEQIRQALSVNLFNSKLSITESFNYDVEGNYPDSFKAALSYEGLQLAYTMKYTNPYDFDSDKGWVSQSEKKFIPYSASLAYTLKTKTFKLWNSKIEIAPSLNTSLVVDFVKPTNSYFIFSPGLTFKINNVIDITFSATSRNDVLYRYVQSALGYPGRIPGEENMFVDLFNSFRFDSETLRKSSGFKLKSLNFSITHDLHDWDLKCEFRIEPRLVTSSTGQKSYDFSPYFTISVVWRPMEALKTEVLDEYGEWKLK